MPRPSISPALAMLAAISFQGWGGTLAVSPVRVHLSSDQPTAVITVENQSGTARVYQLEAVAWTQADGEDRYSPTRELVAVPPVFQLGPHKSQIVRVGLQRPREATELAYRLFIQELPGDAAAQEAGMAVQTLLRIGIPVFADPAAPVPKPRLVWTAERTAAGVTAFIVENVSRVHIQVGRVTVRGAERTSMNAGFYVLAGQKRRWAFPDVLEVPDGALGIESETDQGRLVDEAVIQK